MSPCPRHIQSLRSRLRRETPTSCPKSDRETATGTFPTTGVPCDAVWWRHGQGNVTFDSHSACFGWNKSEKHSIYDRILLFFNNIHKVNVVSPTDPGSSPASVPQSSGLDQDCRALRIPGGLREETWVHLQDTCPHTPGSHTCMMSATSCSENTAALPMTSPSTPSWRVAFPVKNCNDRTGPPEGVPELPELKRYISS